MALTEEEEVDNGKIKGQGLHRRSDEVLSKMLDSHSDKLPVVQVDLDRLNDPDGFAGVIYEFTLGEDGLNKGLARIEADKEKNFYQAKTDKLNEFVRLIQVEKGFRRDGKVDRAGDIVP